MATAVALKELDDSYKVLVRQRASYKGKITVIIKNLDSLDLEQLQESLFIRREKEVFNLLDKIETKNEEILEVFNRAGLSDEDQHRVNEV